MLVGSGKDYTDLSTKNGGGGYEGAHACVRKVVLLCIWAIPQKLAPISENTVFAHFANIIKHFNIYLYLNHHFG